jgi:hypothetical protein
MRGMKSAVKIDFIAEGHAALIDIIQMAVAR